MCTLVTPPPTSSRATNSDGASSPTSPPAASSASPKGSRSSRSSSAAGRGLLLGRRVQQAAARVLPGVLVGERGHVDDRRVEARVADQLGPVLDHLLLGRHQQELHLSRADVRLQDLEVQRDVVDVEGHVLLGLPVDGLARVLLAHLVHHDLLDDDRTAAHGGGDGLGRHVGLVGRLADGLDHQFAVHDLAVDDGLRRQIGHAEVRQHGPVAGQIQAKDLDDIGADVHADEGFPFPFQESEHLKPALLFVRFAGDPVAPGPSRGRSATSVPAPCSTRCGPRLERKTPDRFPWRPIVPPDAAAPAGRPAPWPGRNCPRAGSTGPHESQIPGQGGIAPQQPEGRRRRQEGAEGQLGRTLDPAAARRQGPDRAQEGARRTGPPAPPTAPGTCRSPP